MAEENAKTGANCRAARAKAAVDGIPTMGFVMG